MYRARARAFLLLHQLVDAVQDLTRATELSPQNADVWYELAEAQYMSGLLLPAYDDSLLRHALAIDPARKETRPVSPPSVSVVADYVSMGQMCRQTCWRACCVSIWTAARKRSNI